MSAHQYDEGHTVAGWTGVAIATVGTSVLGVGVCMVSTALIAVGLATTLVSALVTWALHLSGWGKPPGRRPREQWGMRVRDTSARDGHPGCVGCRMAGRGGSRVTAVEPRGGAAGQAEPVPAESAG
ncbi:HGxxPAAW family protein [Streptomyces sp. NPDC048420]|uniref:HGxxPAAW family protein n=1 Tax=Streptomyces sp. NPDC048420 TaxID=3155755 RepID=UPI00344AE873